MSEHSIDDQSRMAKRTVALRKSKEYKPRNPDKQQHSWPAQPTYENPIVYVLHNNAYGFLNFVLLNGQKTELATDGTTILTT